MNCHDCKKELEIENEELQNGKMLKYKKGEEEFLIAKCNECFEINPALNFQKCEVYSRVCGYMRPVQSWNKAKLAEYQERNNFKITTER